MNKYIKYKVYNLNGGSTLSKIITEIRDGIYNSGSIPLHTNGWKRYNEINHMIKLLNQNLKISKRSNIESILLSFNINTINHIYIEPLHFAIINNYTDMLDIQKYSTQDINKLNYFGFTPLFLAIFKNNENIVNKLIQNGANVNLTPPNKLSPYNYALLKNYNNIANLIHAAGGR